MDVLNLTFKPGTDDLREVASLENIKLLLKQDAETYACNPVGTDNFHKKYPDGKNSKGSITYVSKPEDALQDPNVCFLFIE